MRRWIALLVAATIMTGCETMSDGFADARKSVSTAGTKVSTSARNLWTKIFGGEKKPPPKKKRTRRKTKTVTHESSSPPATNTQTSTDTGFDTYVEPSFAPEY